MWIEKKELKKRKQEAKENYEKINGKTAREKGGGNSNSEKTLHTISLTKSVENFKKIN